MLVKLKFLKIINFFLFLKLLFKSKNFFSYKNFIYILYNGEIVLPIYKIFLNFKKINYKESFI
jgi:hypothetical protein